MPETTTAEPKTNAPSENASRSETHSAEPPASHASDFLRQRPRTRIFLVVGIIVLLIAGIFAWRYFSSYESTDDAEVDGHLMPVSARISGYVATVNVDDNQYVKAGQVLVEIDPRDYQIAVDQARADVGTSQGT